VARLVGGLIFPNVSSFRDRTGKQRYRYRRVGHRTAYLPGLPGSPEFLAAYERAVNGDEANEGVGSKRTKAGTINALAVQIYQSAEWQALSASTQRTYRGILEQLRASHGDKMVRAIDVEVCHRLRDRKAATPAAANNLIKVLRWALEFALRRNQLKSNPAARVKPLKIRSDGFHTWTDDQISIFEANWPVGTRERLAFDLFLYTGQRRGDVRRLGRQHLADGQLSLRQEKTGAQLVIPIHAALAASLATVPSAQLTLLVTQSGQPFSAAGLGNWFGDACRAAGLAGCTAHGLRKAAARRLAEAGCTAHEIMSITGHRTLKEVDRYTRAAAQRGLAVTAISKIGGT